MRDVGDFVQKQRAAVGHLEAADAIHLGVGERALHMAEQLAFENAFGQAAGIDRHHRPRGAKETACRVCATTSLPVPCSPVIRTFASDGPTREIGPAPAAWPPIRNQLGRALGPQRRFSASSRWPAAQRVAQLDLRLQNRKAARCPKASG